MHPPATSPGSEPMLEAEHGPLIRHASRLTHRHRHRHRHRQTRFATSSLGAASVRLQKRCRHPRDWLDSLGHVWTGVGRACFLGGDAPLLANRIQVTCMSACTGQHELLPCRCVPGGHVTMSRWIAAAASPEQYEGGKSLQETDWWTRQGMKVTQR